ncbi:MAG TPA: hypothetical protein PKH07_11445 [bacterium]|nr:hypothetical protein [bacterium]
MNMLVSHAFKVSAARTEALRFRSQAWTRPQFWALLTSNILLIWVLGMSSVYLGLKSKQQAYECARLAQTYAELGREIADLQAGIHEMTTVTRIRQVAADNELGLTPGVQSVILLGPEPSHASMGAVRSRETETRTVSSYLSGRAREVASRVLRVFGEWSLFEQTGGAD